MAPAASSQPRTLRVEFSTEADFRREFGRNIVNGGVFVASEERFEPRDRVRVELALRYCRKTVKLAGEVVDCIPASMAGAGGTPGVAVQLLAPAARLREQCEPFLGSEPTAVDARAEARPADRAPATAGGSAAPARSGSPSAAVVEERAAAKPSPAEPRRQAPRAPARVSARLETEDGQGVGGRTRDLSDSGVLVSVEGEPVPVGHDVALTLEHPRTGDSMELHGRVVRHVTSDDGEVTALGIQFVVPEQRSGEVERFVADVKACEHSRRLGGIHGPISELGAEALLKMFMGSAPRGTLVLRRGAHEGRIVFEDGRVRGARLGRAKGMKAFKALLRWREGEFEFFTRPEEVDAGQEPLSLDAAVRRLEDISATLAPEPGLEPERALPPDDTKLSVNVALVKALRGLDKTESAVIELATVGMTIGKIVDIIPEPEDETRAALGSLLERGLIEAG